MLKIVLSNYYILSCGNSETVMVSANVSLSEVISAAGKNHAKGIEKHG